MTRAYDDKTNSRSKGSEMPLRVVVIVEGHGARIVRIELCYSGGLQPRQLLALDFINAIDRADLNAGLAARAIVRADDGQLPRQLLSRLGRSFGHDRSPNYGNGRQ